jgi:RNA polymerase sigma factor (sigma-70 family)
MAGAEELYCELIAPVQERMMRTVSRIVRDPDETMDVFQNVLMTIWKDLKKIHAHPNPHGYILRVCVSASYDALRKRSRMRKHHASIEDDEINVPHPVTMPPYISRETESRIVSAITKLPKQQAMAVLLQVVEDEGFVGIARTLGCTEATARSHLSKGKARLREMLSDLDPRTKKQRHKS